MKNAIVIFLMSIFFVPVHADQLSMSIGYSCDAEKSLLTLSYGGGYSNPGAYQHPSDIDGMEWDLWTFMTAGKKEGWYGDPIVIERTCRLGTSVYHLRFSAEPGNRNSLGFNGGSIEGWAEVNKDGHAVIASDEDSRYWFSGSNEDVNITTKVTISPSRPPIIKQVSKCQYLGYLYCDEELEKH
jgi:hypothetical protein